MKAADKVRTKTDVEKHFQGKPEQFAYLSDECKKLAKWYSLFHGFLF